MKMTENSPKNINEVFPGIPNNINAVFTGQKIIKHISLKDLSI